MRKSGNKFWGLMSKTIVGLVMAMMCCVGDVMATVQKGTAGTTASVMFYEFTCSNANYSTYVSQGYTSVYASKTSTDNTYTGDKEWFLENYCNGDEVVSGTEKCYRVTASGAGIPTTQQKKYLIYAADCVDNNDGSTRNAIYITGSGGVEFGEDNEDPDDSALFVSSIAYVSFLVHCRAVSSSPGTWSSFPRGGAGCVRKISTTYTKLFCNNHTASQTFNFGCGDGYYGPKSGTSTTTVACTACHGDRLGVVGKSTNPIGTSLSSFNTSVSACSYKCDDYFYGTPSSSLGCTRCPLALGYTSTGPTNNAYNTGTDISFCTYECAADFFGTARAMSSTSTTPSGCSACPENATCAGGNESTYSCNTGYYKCYKGEGVDACPCLYEHSGHCLTYGEACNKCPSATYNSSLTDKSGTANYTSEGFTDNAGATAITQCKDNSGDGYYLQKDTSGFWQYGTACPYSK